MDRLRPARRRAPRRPSRRVVPAALLSALLALTGLAALAPAAAAEGSIRDTGTATVVKDSYIVVLKSGSDISTTAAALRKSYGGTIGHTYRHAITGFELAVSEAAAKRLAADPAVSYVQRNGVFHATATQSNPPWGLDRIDQRNLPLSGTYTYDTTASNVHAYVVDTGIRLTHQQFGGRAVSGRDTVNNDNDASDCNGHGTHVAGTVGGSTYGVAKGVQLVAVRVLNCSGSGTTAQVVAGIDWVTANAIKPAVANLSLGGGADSTLDAAVNRAISAGISFAVASGNDTANACNDSPARVAAALTVNASTSSDARASFSNYGNCTDLFAPGQGILSSWYTSDTATNTISGTSMASPHVAGAAALVLAANPGYTPAQVASAIINNATTGVVGNPGSGSPNRLLYTGTGAPPTSPPPTTPPPAGCSGSSGTDVTIPDAGSAVTSSITISGCSRAASSSSTVTVGIVHTYRGDLVVDLLAPDNSSYRLKNSSSLDSADNVNTTYTVNLSSETANGTWRLQVRDVYSSDTGYINTWSITL